MLVRKAHDGRHLCGVGRFHDDGGREEQVFGFVLPVDLQRFGVGLHILRPHDRDKRWICAPVSILS